MRPSGSAGLASSSEILAATSSYPVKSISASRLQAAICLTASSVSTLQLCKYIVRTPHHLHDRARAELSTEALRQPVSEDQLNRTSDADWQQLISGPQGRAGRGGSGLILLRLSHWQPLKAPQPSECPA